MVYDPLADADKVTVEVYQGAGITGTLLDTRTINEQLPAGAYLVGFDADQDNLSLKSYFTDLTIKTLTNAVFNDIEVVGSATFGNILPSANVTYSLGDATHQWKDLWVSNNTVYINSIPLSITDTGNLLINNQPIGATISYGDINGAPIDISDLTDVGNLLVGTPGPQGEIGPQGDTGPQGNVGATGPQGIQGNIGATGLQGIQGIQGNVGAQGSTGPQGIQGNTGPQGSQGIQGIQGNVGEQGPRGFTGNVGDQGPQGDAGPQGNTGAQGTSVTLLGSVDIVGNLPVTANVGEGWIVQADGDLYLWNTISSVWNNIGQIVGPQGDAGPAGPRGFTGNVGAEGPQGIQGEPGPQGEQGIQGNVGPQGEQGIQGNIGLQGETGPQGEQGVPGEQGPQGETGPQGEPGAQGNPGADALWNWQGEYNAEPQYQEGDIVAYQGSTYRRNGVGNSVVGYPPPDATYWELVSAKGAQGEPGTGNANTGNITFNDNDIGSTGNVVNITASEYAQLESNDNFVWVDDEGAHIEVKDGGVFDFEVVDGAAILKLPERGDIVDSTGASVLGGGSGSSSTLVNGDFVVSLQVQGSLLLPTGDYQENESRYQGAIISENESSTIYMDVQTHSQGNVYGGMRLETWNSVPIDIRTRAGGQGDDIKNWRFDSNGSITFPDDTVQTTAYTGTIVRQDTAPTAANGTLWFNTVEGRLYIKYSDVWVDAAPLVQPPPDTDIDVNSITFADATVQTTAWTGPTTVDRLVNGSKEVVLNADGTLALPTSSNDLYTTTNALIKSFADIQISAGDDAGSNWVFGGNGTTKFPNDTIKAPDGSFIQLSDNAGKNFVTVSDTAVSISAQDTTEYNWTFGTNGNLILPQTNMQSSPAPVSLPGITFTDGTFQKTAATGNTLVNGVHTVSLSAGGNLTLPGAVVNSTVAKTGGTVPAPIALDLTKTVNKLTDGVYSLANGVEGQIMYLVKQTGTTYNAVTVIVANARIDGVLYTSIDHYPFSYNTSSIDIDTLIFTDGAWQAQGGSWD
jgi:hypothetical protein